jgi:glutamate-ammonia-ligase adenylyltransferase
MLSLPDALAAEAGAAREAIEAACAEAALPSPQWPQGHERALAFSRFIAQAGATHPQAFSELLASGDLGRVYAPEAWAERVCTGLAVVQDEAGLALALRRLRQREMLRIAWRDLVGAADLDETLSDLSRLADHLVDAALAWLYAEHCTRYGTPRADGQAQQLVVLGMGKLGGGELNFSSDIDLIFAFPQDGRCDGPGELENQQFFIRLGQRLIAALSQQSAEGFVYRVDMRLRPFGDVGPLVASFDAIEEYYQSHGREWERYALVKARAIAGDRAAGESLLERLRPFVYRRYLDYGAFAALREMKALIDREAARKRAVDNIKLGAGGIREIEFIGQVFQLIRGGRDLDLQLRGIREVLRRLVARELLPAHGEAALQAAYVFLRRTENRLQMFADQQTHRLPQEAPARERLACAMGYPDWARFVEALDQHRRAVQGQFDGVFAAPQIDGTQPGGVEREVAALWQGGGSGSSEARLLEGLGYDDPEAVIEELATLREGRVVRSLSETGRARLDRLIPLLLGAAAQADEPLETLRRVLALVASVAQRSVYIALLAENPLALSQLLRLCAASPWIADRVAHHPLLLDELLDARSLYAPLGRDELGAALREELAGVEPDDLEQLMDRLRNFKESQVLKVAAADVMRVLPLMKVSDQLTWIAEAVLEEVLLIAWRQLIAKHGEPRCEVDGVPRGAGFSIIAYGKLGGIELGYGSDLDIVFLHDSAGAAQHTQGPRELENSVFFARLAQRIIHILTALTPAGVLYEVDTRLRPSGASGLMVSSLAAFENYQFEQAWTWEHQALLRARPVAGEPRIAAAFQGLREQVICRERERETLRGEVREMRERMWAEHASKEAGVFDLKRDPGGIADIEFVVQYMVLAHAGDHPALTEYTDNIRNLEALRSCGLMPDSDVQTLMDAYRALRDRVHALTLQDRPERVAEAEFSELRAEVRRIWREVMVD